jgi:hypothetical protein
LFVLEKGLPMDKPDACEGGKDFRQASAKPAEKALFKAYTRFA